ncbi:MAG TPA: hypothetical protein VJN71_10675 [Nitrososphaerales archaeon]|nr:hypothetical protein [Nitrososphaerales archaeon]
MYSTFRVTAPVCLQEKKIEQLEKDKKFLGLSFWVSTQCGSEITPDRIAMRYIKQ